MSLGPALTTVDRQRDRRSVEAQRRGGEHEPAEGPGKRDLQTQLRAFWEQCLWLIPSPHCGQTEPADHT